MQYVITGLGNPDKEYEMTRHNAGRMVVSNLYPRWKCGEWKKNTKLAAQSALCTVKKEEALLLLPDTYMNRSGAAVKPIITTMKKAERLIVVHDDIDLPLGSFKISYGRGSGGHRGVESIIRAVKTRNFLRIRIGISPAVRGGGVRKPKGEQKVLDFLMGNFKKAELSVITHLARDVSEAIQAIMTDGPARAMSEFNG